MPDITNPFFAEAVTGIESSSRDDLYNIFLCNTGESAARQTDVLDSLVGRVDALVLAPATESPDVPKALETMGVPVVLLDREFADRSLYDSVLVDNEGGAASAARYLAQLGHTRIGLISGTLSSTPGRTRHEGFLRALADEGFSLPRDYVRVGDFHEVDGYLATQSVLSLPVRPTALFVANNLMAVGALNALRESRLRLRDDISFVSFDDLPFARLIEPTLTAVVRPTVEQGALAASLLTERLRGEAPATARRCVLETSLSVRGSCGPPPRNQR